MPIMRMLSLDQMWLKYPFPLKNDPIKNISTAPSSPTYAEAQLVENVENVDGLAPASLWQPELDEPSLYALLDAEFSADRDDTTRAIAIYKDQSFKEMQPPCSKER